MSALESAPRPFGPRQLLICLNGVVWRELLRFLHQRERFVSALVRPLVWLFIFAAGWLREGETAAPIVTREVDDALDLADVI